MAIGKHNDYTFYKGYEGEPEFVVHISSEDSTVFHVWEGYLADIFDNAVISDEGWKGLTRDYQEDEGVFDKLENFITEETDEYLCDLKQYLGVTFRFEETEAVLQMLIKIFEQASATDASVIMELV